MSKFIQGLRLSELYYRQVIEPILTRKFPNLKYSAGLIGTGSEVIGYDTSQSTDHNWGLRLILFLSETDLRKKKRQIDNEVRRNLPLTFLGYPTSFGKPDEIGVRLPDLSKRAKGYVNHYIVFLTINQFLRQHLSIDDYKNIKARTWLATPQQKLLELTSGRIFHDNLGIKTIINKFSYYPRDVWLYIMASQWLKISQEEAFVARTSAVGDELGSKIIASRITKELMELCFMMEKKYVPYSKWFGKAFSELKIAGELKPILVKVLETNSIDEREKWLSKAYRNVARKHNSLHITDPISTNPSIFYNRPYLVIHGDKFASEIREKIKDKRLQSLPLIGSIDQVTDNQELKKRISVSTKFLER
jgi:hypothetical protein